MLFRCIVSSRLDVFVPADVLIVVQVYTPPNAAIRGCRVFDTENGEARHVMQGEYDSVEGVIQG